MIIPLINREIAISKVFGILAVLSILAALAIGVSYQYFENWYYFLIIFVTVVFLSTYKYLKNRWINYAVIDANTINVFYSNKILKIPKENLHKIDSAWSYESRFSRKLSRIYLIRFKGRYAFGDTLLTEDKSKSNFKDFVNECPIYIRVLEKEIEYYSKQKKAITPSSQANYSRESSGRI